MKISIEALTEVLNLQKEKQPLIHCISSMVTMNDLAQGILSYNGKPIMAPGIDEVGEITASANALLINLGTLDSSRVEAMEKSIRIASKKNKPIVLDAIGVDISFFRREIALVFLTRYKIDVIKGNVSEIKALLEKKPKKNKEHKEIIESKEQNINNENEEFVKNTIKDDYEIREQMREFSKKYKSILIATGNENYITDGFSEFFINNGNDEFDRVVGVDSLLGGLISVGVAVARTNAEKVQAVLIAIMTMGVSKELAYEKMDKKQGLISLKNSLIDEISLINNKKLEAMGKISYIFKR
ncbi:hydroxyethylthiazole kinase [Clostridium gasigenes]|uniref:hydroxyethylthiazole kinase n=1 Tax=Clostridium gasigenes TaxID=94869 RepID=UPI001627C8A0|nr:hydroxyethylthiazole kinase [Clostridium gasigenes]MBB6623989.1 hydroxyethylthiazole kinase [Clostridium gasigenes]MBU3088388.1 hydroxyethylthiazole kinase [Clostridium gasigenes]MBU3103254.1 hydroxyethylthiazole kinase [Clostridium gasigenes]